MRFAFLYLSPKLTESSLGEDTLDRVCLALGGKVVAPLVLPSISHLLNHSEWRKQRAGLFAFSVVSEACREQLLPAMAPFVHKVIEHMESSQPEVQWAAIHCGKIVLIVHFEGGQIATDLQPQLQKEFGHRLVPVFLRIVRSPILA